MPGAAIHELNCVRKHLSVDQRRPAAAATRAPSLTWALSDVVGPVEDDPSVIGSGPTVGDPTTFAEAVGIVDAARGHASGCRAGDGACSKQGVRGERPETPKPGDPRLARARFEVVGGRRHAMAGARREAERRGYDVVTIDEPIVGEARDGGAGACSSARAR